MKCDVCPEKDKCPLNEDRFTLSGLLEIINCDIKKKPDGEKGGGQNGT